MERESLLDRLEYILSNIFHIYYTKFSLNKITKVCIDFPLMGSLWIWFSENKNSIIEIDWYNI